MNNLLKTLFVMNLSACISSGSKNTEPSTTTDNRLYDILLVFDNSGSMAEERAAVLESFALLWEGLSPDAGFQLGITASDSTTALGLLAGEPKLLTADTIEEVFPSTMDSLPVGSGQEEPLEAAFMALCRAADPPPSSCMHTTSSFTEAEIGSNEGFLTAGSTVVILSISDEGDSSRQISPGDDDVSIYQDAYTEFNHPLVFLALGPAYDQSTGIIDCNSGGASAWGVQRFSSLVEATNGIYLPLQSINENGECESTNMDDNMSAFAEQLNSL